MYLKIVNKKEIEKYGLNNAFGVSIFEGSWYYQMNDNGTKARNSKGSLLLTRLAPEGLREVLESGEFSRVEN